MMRGFTLIEVLVAIFILGLMLVAFVVTAGNIPLARYAKDQDLALKIAGNELSTLRGNGYDALPASGSFSDSQLSQLALGEGAVAVSSWNGKTKSVTVTVTWQEGQQAASSTVSLTTLVTKTGGL